MKDILDAANLWKGSPIGSSFSSVNKAPVAVDDVRSVVQDSAPVTFVVLSNDVDPEGQPLTLVSASAALGTAVAEADNTVTYTPPPGIAGFDTVVYEVADDLGQTDTAQINITITEPELAINTLSDNTMVITARTGAIDVSVSAPAQFAGTYGFDTADLTGGPVNLVPPGATGTVSLGQTLTAEQGLWVHDADAGDPVRSWQWQRGGTDIGGATGASYVVQSADLGAAITARETQTDGAGQRSARQCLRAIGRRRADRLARRFRCRHDHRAVHGLGLGRQGERRRGPRARDRGGAPGDGHPHAERPERARFRWRRLSGPVRDAAGVGRCGPPYGADHRRRGQ
ncbi:MAG: Ig-like domain-containing protein [Rhodobacter sp.]|nr:Ig-like domain-containing protein [Rhodobacter sp.]